MRLKILACNSLWLMCVFAASAAAGQADDTEKSEPIRGQARSSFRSLAPNVRQDDATHPLEPAIALLRQCQGEFSTVFDYQARLIQQERVGKKLLPEEVIHAKFRRAPFSVYYRWSAPEAGREAIYVEGRDGDKILTHPPGLKRAIVGVQRIDPESTEARRERRRSLRDSGIGAMIDKTLVLWDYERRYRETEVEITHVKVNGRPCILIAAVHPHPDDGKFMYHTLKVYVDKDLSLPIRWEAYGYPEESGREAGDLLECYTYLEVRLNTGLGEEDFSPANPRYDFRRF